MTTLATAYERIAHAAGHVLAAPFAVTVLALLWIWLGLEATNFAISIISLLLLFVLQSSSNRDGIAIQAKLDTLIKGVPDASDDMIGIDRLPVTEVESKRQDCP